MKNIAFRNLADVFFPDISAENRREIDRDNIRMMTVIAVITMIMETVILIFLLAARHAHPEDAASYAFSIRNVSLCVAFCFVFLFWSRILLRRKDSLSHISCVFCLTVAYFALSVWGGNTSMMHYEQGDQMVTFFIVQLVFVAFIAFEPAHAIILYAVSFAEMMRLLRMIDGAGRVNSVNFFAFMAMCMAVAVVKFHEALNVRTRIDKIEDLNDILKDTAEHDDLTGMLNRHGLQEDLQNYLNISVHVMMFDIDNFKQFNDTYGHAIGDEVLSRVSNTLKNIFGIEHCYRYGGDEFLAIIPEMEEEKFEEYMNLWAGAVSRIRIPEMPGEHITCSCGYVFDAARNEATLRELIRTADQNLYEMKKRKHVGR